MAHRILTVLEPTIAALYWTIISTVPEKYIKLKNNINYDYVAL